MGNEYETLKKKVCKCEKDSASSGIRTHTQNDKTDTIEPNALPTDPQEWNIFFCKKVTRVNLGVS